MRSHSSETSENIANVNSQKRHCFCLAWLWHSEGLQKHLYAITHRMMVLPHQSKRQLCWCKLHSLHQYQKLEHRTRACVIIKTLVNENLGDFQGHPQPIRCAAQHSQKPCISMQVFICTTRFSL